MLYNLMKLHIELLEKRIDELQEEYETLENKIEEMSEKIEGKSEIKEVEPITIKWNPDVSFYKEKEFTLKIPLRKNILLEELQKQFEKTPRQKLDEFIEINNLKANIPNFYFENCNDVYRSLLHILEQEVVDADDEGYVVRFIDVDFDVKDDIPKLIIYMQESSGMHVQTYKYNKEDEEFYFEDSNYLHNFFNE
jgi:hypothetical protein